MNKQILKTQNSQPTATEMLEFANLQIAAEALHNLLTAPAGTPDKLMSTTEIDRINDALEANLIDGNNHSSKFTTTQAEQFAQNWKVVQHIANTKSGFSGTLFENTETHELVISFRSTEFVEDQLRDSVVTNTSEIKEHGWAFGQISDMEEWFNSLKTAGLIPNGQKINVTGYSLGGHLATAFHILHQNDELIKIYENPKLIKNTLTFNGAGVGSMGGDKVTTDEELYSYC